MFSVKAKRTDERGKEGKLAQVVLPHMCYRQCEEKPRERKGGERKIWSYNKSTEEKPLRRVRSEKSPKMSFKSTLREISEREKSMENKIDERAKGE